MAPISIECHFRGF